MADGMSHVDYAAQAVLSSSELLLASPSNAKLTTFYPVPSECTSVIAQSICNTGQLFVAGNSQGFGTSTNFQISSANIIDTPMLEIKVRVQNTTANPFHYCFVEDGWGYGLFRSYEVTYSNSNISNLVTRSGALRDWNLSQQQNHERRQRLLKDAGEGETFLLLAGQERSFDVSIPLSFLNWGAASVSAPGFPFDARTINGIIQIQINWVEDIFEVLTLPRTGPSANVDPIVRSTRPVGTISRSVVTMRSYQLLDSSFSVGNALAMDPSKRYVLPAKWLNSYTYEVAVEPSATNTALYPLANCPKYLEGTIELNSAPAGMLQGIIIHVRPIRALNGVNDAPDATWTKGDARQKRLGGLRLHKLNLTYSGQNIIRLETEEELNSFMKYIYGDDMKTRARTQYPSIQPTDGSNRKIGFPAAPGVPTFLENDCEIEHQTYIIPLMHDGEKVFRERHFENLPQYSGSALSLKFGVVNGAYFYSEREPATFGDTTDFNDTNSKGGDARSALNRRILQPQLTPNTGPAYDTSVIRFTTVEVTITYVMAALLQNSNGMVEIQL